MAGITGPIKTILTENLVYKLSALVVAILLWIWVQNEQVVTEQARVRLEWLLPDGLLPAEKTQEIATLTLEGVQLAIRAARQKDLTMRIDLSEVRSGEAQIDLSSYSVTNLPPQVRITSIAPATLAVKLERAFESNFIIHPSPIGELAPGFTLTSILVEPRKIALIGPISRLKNLTSINTEPIEIAGLSEDASFKVGLDLPNGVRTVQPGTIDVRVEIDEVQISRKFGNVHIQAGDLTPTGPVDITLSGPQRTIERLDPDSIQVVIDVPERLRGRSFRAYPGTGAGLRYRIVLPDDQLKVEKVEPDRILLTRP